MPGDVYVYDDPNEDGPGRSTLLPDTRPWEAPIKYCLVAIVILGSLLFIVRCFKHFFRPTTPSLPSSSEEHQVTTFNASDYPVLMPGELHPTHIAQPAPLPCPREGIRGPSHEE